MDQPCLSRCWIWNLGNLEPIFALWQSALPCWKRPQPSEKTDGFTWSATMCRKVVQAKVTSTWLDPRLSPKKTWFSPRVQRATIHFVFQQISIGTCMNLFISVCSSAVALLWVFFPPHAAMSLGRPWPCCRFTRCPSLDQFWWVRSTADRDDPTRPVKAAQIH